MSTSETVDALDAPRRTVLDPILVDAARAAGAMVRFQTGLVDLVRDDRGQVTGAVSKGASGATYTVAAERVSGADGAGSTVARLAGAPFDERMTHATAVVYGYWSGLENDGYHWHYRPSTSVGVIPSTGGETCVFAAMPPARLKGEYPTASTTRCSPSARPGSGTGSRASDSRADSPPSPAIPASAAGRMARAGRWSAMPATSGTRSPRTARPTRCAMPNYWRLPWSPAPRRRSAITARCAMPSRYHYSR